jgi:putative hydrolase of the HAD superfamily
MTGIRNIIFDLGGVFLNIDYQLTEQAFIDLGITDFGARFNQQFSNPLFEALETGDIKPGDFYAAFRAETQTMLTDDQIRDAWNALLLDFPPERLDWLAEIGQRYPVYLFSNTNQIHYDAFMAAFGNLYPGRDFNAYFRKAYYSHELGLRKPYVGSYQRILAEQGLEPGETLFIDDTAKNILGAAEAGLQTLHLVPGMTVLDLNL